MQSFLQTYILRHARENLRKCSLKGLEARSDMRFFTYPKDVLPSLENYVLLVVEDAPLLSTEDAAHGVLLLDSTWHYLDKMLKYISNDQNLQKRTLPGHFRTAYPRRQEGCIDPARGLSSIEALFIAYQILGRESEGLLDRYYWKKDFLKINQIY